MIKTVKADLFTSHETYALAHCISSDYAMGAGIAVKFNKIFKSVNYIRGILEYPKTRLVWPEVVVQEHESRTIFHLVTKKNYWGKPTYGTIKKSLERMKEEALSRNIKRIAMPMIGAGLDKLQWSKVEEIIREIFEESGIDIKIYRLK